jgi:hypothetical protein
LLIEKVNSFKAVVIATRFIAVILRVIVAIVKDFRCRSSKLKYSSKTFLWTMDWVTAKVIGIIGTAGFLIS